MGGTATERRTHLVTWEVVTKPKEDGGLGLHAMRQLTSALMMKLGWRMQMEPGGLWSTILKHKYCNGTDLLLRSIQGNSSNVWKRVMAQKDALQWGIGRAIGDETGTLFWTDIWAMDRPLLDVAIAPVPLNMHAQRVSDYWDRMQGW